MATLNFDDFYNQIRPFTAKRVDKHEQQRAAFTEELGADASNSVVLTARALKQVLWIAAIENTAGRVLPNSPQVQRLIKKAALRMLDCEVGIRQHEVAPLTMARDLPEAVRTQLFADYAKSLSLPHIARVIEAAVRHLPPAAPSPAA